MLAPLLLLVQAVASPQYPATEVLAGFTGLFSDTSSIEAVQAAATRDEWVSFTPAQDSSLGRVLDFASGEIVTRTFHRTIQGRLIEALVTRHGNKVGCRVYDFEATNPIGDELLIAWAGAPPTGRTPLPDVLQSLIWTPGHPFTADRVQISFVPNTSLANVTGLRGVAMAALSSNESSQ